MAEIQTYLNAATRANTRRTYAGAVRHYEVEAGRRLPATGEQVAQYLVDYAAQLSAPTLRHRLAALAQWHRDQGFPDPTKAPIVRQVFRGIRTLHPHVERQATPLQLVHLGQVADALEHATQRADADGDPGVSLRSRRDRALVLLGFWRAFRGDELMRLQAQYVQIDSGKGLSCFLPQSKGDRESLGRTCKVPALTRWCPVAATSEWLLASRLTDGPLFRSINRWGQLGADGLHSNSFVPLLRGIFADGGVPAPAGYSGHSLRRGFAGWAESQGWDLKSLMDYVGWRDVHSAMRYLEPDPFQRLRVSGDHAGQQLTVAPAGDDVPRLATARTEQQ